MKPQNLEESVVFYCITGTYILYVMGAQFIVIPIMSWLLTAYLFKKLWHQTDKTPIQERIVIPAAVWVWIVAVIIIEIALVIGHLEFGMGLVTIAKRTVNAYGRTWLLYALIPLIGCLPIRKSLVYRAACILCLQSLILIPICYMAHQAGLPSTIYDSPLAKVGGSGDIFYRVRWYMPEGDGARMTLFAPWAPILGLAANVYFAITRFEPNKKWRLIGMTGAAAMAWTSGSRAAQVCLVAMPFIVWIAIRISKPIYLFAVGFASALAGWFSTHLMNWAEDFKNYFDNMRDSGAASSLERHLLQRITRYKWWNDAPIWGHGDVQKGPIIVNFQTLGSHHTWNGLLYVHGIVGFSAFAFAFLWTFVELLIKAQKREAARAGLNIILVIFLFTFVDTLGTPLYTFWPGLLMIGLGLKETMPTLEELFGPPKEGHEPAINTNLNS